MEVKLKDEKYKKFKDLPQNTIFIWRGEAYYKVWDSVNGGDVAVFLRKGVIQTCPQKALVERVVRGKFVEGA